MPSVARASDYHHHIFLQFRSDFKNSRKNPLIPRISYISTLARRVGLHKPASADELLAECRAAPLIRPTTMPKKSVIFAELLLECRRDLFGLIYSLVQNLADAEDIYQDTALLLWKKFDEFTIGTNFSAWAMRVAHLRVLKHAAAKRNQRLLFSDAVLDSISQAYQRETIGEGSRRAEALDLCLQKLSVRDRRLVTRCYAPDRNYADIARSEGRTIGAVYQAIDRIRKSLFACVERSLAMESRR